MGKVLIVAEKPSVARDIAQALGGFQKREDCFERDDAVISSALGHLVELHVPEAATAARGLASLPIIPSRFDLKVIDDGKAKGQFNLLSRLMRRSDVSEVVNACDAGREGELIFRLIYDLAGCRKPVRRMWLQSMTPDAIREGYRSLRPSAEFDALGAAALCRAEADWLVGINGSRGITSLYEQQTGAREQRSAGRVQTPTLAILVDIEEAIRTFVPVDYWEVHATFGCQAGSYVGRWAGAAVADENERDASEEESARSRMFDRAVAQAIVEKCRGVDPSSVRDESETVRTEPPKLFDLTTLQREANKRFKLTAKQTLGIAQALYEKHKATTYPRTDSNALPEDYIESAKGVLATFGGTPYESVSQRALAESWVRPNKRVFDNSRISDHFAIIPTGTQPSGLTREEGLIYDMVVRRFIAAFYPAAEYNRTTRFTSVAGEIFRSSGRVLVKAGWLDVYGKQGPKDSAPSLCPLDDGEHVRTQSVVLKDLQTKPPSRLTEAGLLAAMEAAGKLVDDDDLRDAMKDRGLGTPATRASMIEALVADTDAQKRPKEPYACRVGEEQYLVPTKKGESLIRFLRSNGLELLTSPRMTGEWEAKLRQMEKRGYRRDAFMGEVADLTHKIIDAIRRNAAAAPPPQIPLLAAACPRCGGSVLAGPRTFECQAACGFKLWREIAKRSLSDAEAAELITEGATKQLDDFVSNKGGRKFSAALKLNVAENKVEFVFEERASDTQAAGPGPELSARCPRCSGVLRDRGRWYGCDAGDYKLWSDIAGRRLAPHEADRLLNEGQHPPLDGFTSTRGNSFSAGLRLSRDKSKVEFVFER